MLKSSGMQFHVQLGTNVSEVPVTSFFTLSQAKMMEAAAAFIMLVPTYQITWLHYPED